MNPESLTAEPTLCLKDVRGRTTEWVKSNAGAVLQSYEQR